MEARVLEVNLRRTDFENFYQQEHILNKVPKVHEGLPPEKKAKHSS